MLFSKYNVEGKNILDNITAEALAAPKETVERITIALLNDLIRLKPGIYLIKGKILDHSAVLHKVKPSRGTTKAARLEKRAGL